VTRELADLACVCEQQRAILMEDISALRRQLEEQRSSVEKAFGRERERQKYESMEMRAIMDAIWQRALATPQEPQAESSSSRRIFAYSDGALKEFVGDPEDIATLYDMVREALADFTYLQKQVTDEREERQSEVCALDKRLERNEFRLNAVQAIVRTACSASHSSPRRPRTLASLAAQDPKWGRLLRDPGQLFSADDIIDKAYKKYLGDVLALMVEHDCSFKRAIELSTAEASAQDAGLLASIPARPACSHEAPLHEYEYEHQLEDAQVDEAGPSDTESGAALPLHEAPDEEPEQLPEGDDPERKYQGEGGPGRTDKVVEAVGSSVSTVTTALSNPGPSAGVVN